MFSVRQKREISEEIQKILRSTNHHELPKGEIEFEINIKGAESWSWACIKNNGSIINPAVNPHNEFMDKDQYESKKCSIKGCENKQSCSILIEGYDILSVCLDCKKKYDNMIQEAIKRDMPKIIAKQNEKSISIGFNMDEMK